MHRRALRVHYLWPFVVPFLVSAMASAQPPALVQRLTQFGEMEPRTARTLLRKVEASLRRHAERGGDRFDRVRIAVLRALHGPSAHPARTRPDYDRQLAEVLKRMRSGLDEPLLVALFQPGPNAAVLCAYEHGLSMPECDALLAAASGRPAALPYTPPDNGKLLEQALRKARVRRRAARRIVRSIRTLMLGVPRSLTRDEKGRTILALLEACPGGLSSREAQIRAWHVGPTPGLVRCIVGAWGARAGAQTPEQFQQWLGLSRQEASALLAWAGVATPSRAPAPQPSATPQPGTTPQPGATPQPGTTPQPSATPQPGTTPAAPRRGAAPDPSLAEQWRRRARGLYGQGRFIEAARAYRHATQADPRDGKLWAGLGASLLHAGDPRGAVEAYERAVERVPSQMGYRVALARALVMAGRRAKAIRTLREVLIYAPQHPGAVQGLLALGEEPKPLEPELPQTPSRDQVIMVMRPLRAALAECAPEFHGQVAFEVEVAGESGEVTRARLQGDLKGTPQAECMESVVRSATFPRFKKRKVQIVYPYEL